jgi:hypothetical protein
MNPTEIDESREKEIAEALNRGIRSILRGIDFVAANKVEDPEVARDMVAVGLDGLSALAADSINKGALFDREQERLEQHYLKVIADEAIGRAYLGLPPTPALQPKDRTVLEDIAAGQAAMADRQAALVAELTQMVAEARATQGPLFSEASAAYRDELARANGEDDKRPTEKEVG